jgi:hypothetical protein
MLDCDTVSLLCDPLDKEIVCKFAVFCEEIWNEIFVCIFSETVMLCNCFLRVFMLLSKLVILASNYCRFLSKVKTGSFVVTVGLANNVA